MNLWLKNKILKEKGTGEFGGGKGFRLKYKF